MRNCEGKKENRKEEQEEVKKRGRTEQKPSSDKHKDCPKGKECF